MEDKPQLFHLAYQAGAVPWDPHIVDNYAALWLHGTTLPPHPPEPFKVSGTGFTTDFDFVRLAFEQVVNLHETLTYHLRKTPDGDVVPCVSNSALMRTVEVLTKGREEFRARTTMAAGIFIEHMTRHRKHPETLAKLQLMVPYLQRLYQDQSLLRIEIGSLET